MAIRHGWSIAVSTCILSACGGGSDDVTVVPSPQACSAEALAKLSLPDAQVIAASAVAAGEFRPRENARPLQNLPAFCRVNAVSTPTPASRIEFELWIPDGEAWNGKLVTTGNGGYSPALSYDDMAYAMRQGYAVVGGDTGHQTEDMEWGFQNPERIRDWGSRSIHAITVASKAILEGATTRAASRSYYLGCSTGGHQGFAQTQQYPADFDGVIAGAPGNNRTALNMEFLWRFRANRPFGDNATQYLDSAALNLITRSAVQACDRLDGVADGVIDDPQQCTTEHFDVASLRCPLADGGACLTDAQITAAQAIYQGPRNPRTGAQLYPGWAVGSESGWAGYMGFGAPVRADFWRLWVFEDRAWDWWTFDFDQDVDTAYRKIAPLVDQTSADLSGFKARNGKLIVYHGWNDPVVSPFDSIDYYERVAREQGSAGAMNDFYRLFLVPGMGHCQGGPGVTQLRSTDPSPRPQQDLLAALDRWVESGVAPDDVIATRDVSGEPRRTRPLCAYPTKAVYDGAGPPEAASSYQCR